MNKKSIEDVDVSNKKVICRVDYNVPLNDRLEIRDDLRIVSSFKTLNYILNKGGAVILITHLGRPKGKVNEKLRLRPIFNYLKEKLPNSCYYVNDCIGDEVENIAKNLKSGEVLLLENLRFHTGEESNDSEFSKNLAKLADIYVNDAFGTAHRSHASTHGITKFISESVAGFLMMKELDYLIKAVEYPIRPLTAIVGGKKISDKINVLKRLVEKCDNILIGGGMAYTFFKVQGINIGNSIVDQKGIDTAKHVLETAKNLNKNLLLPIDIVIADSFSAQANTKLIDIKEGIPDGWQGLDIGYKSIESFTNILDQSKMLIWNGPMGVFEFEKFATGTRELIKFIAEHSMISIVGGGDTASAIDMFGYSSKMTHISTGGGATLELLEGKELPGITALDDLKIILK